MKELINKIQENGYWKVVIRPITFKEDQINSIDECKKIIESQQVVLMGWSYPHIDKGGIRISGNDNIESFCDSDFVGHYEYWRFYQSGQFIHYFSMIEDFRVVGEKLQTVQRNLGTKSIKFLSIDSTIYLITEIFQFTQRLASMGVLGDSLEIIIELGNIEGRQLFFWDSFSRFLNSNYICTFRNENIIFKRIFSKETISKNAQEIAIDVCMDMFRKFNWAEAPRVVFIEDQKKLLERRL